MAKRKPLFARPEFGLCRTLNHAWTQEGPLRRSGGTVLVAFRCAVCTTERRDTILLSTGEVVNRGYYHPDGYLRSREDEPVTKQDYRKAWVQQVMKAPDMTVIRYRGNEIAPAVADFAAARRARREAS